MNIKKILKEKIGFYDRKAYSDVFCKMIEDLHNNKNNNFYKEKKLFECNEKNSDFSFWANVKNCVEEINEKYLVPKIVYEYLNIKAIEKYLKIVKLCKIQKLNFVEIIKIVK